MGGSIEQSEVVGSMGSRRSTVAFQSEGNAGCLVRAKRSLSAPSRLIAVNTERQSNSGILLEKRRGYQIDSFDGNDIQNFRFIGPIQYSHRDTLHSGPIQRRSRSVVTLSSSAGMAPPSTDYIRDFYQMGPPCDRPVCLVNSSCSPRLRHPGPERPASTSPRRIQSRMALFPSMGISSTVSHPPSLATPQFSNRRVFSGSPEMDESILAAGPKEPCAESSVHNMEPAPGSDRHSNEPIPSTDTRHVPGGVEMWGWTECLLGWTNRQRQFLQKSWRESSLKTYKPAWQKWCTWATENSVSIIDPSGADVARYLIDLHQIHGLAYRTILVYKSAVSVLCNPNSETRLSSHVLVKQALRAIGNSQIINNPKIKAPIWDTDVLTNWLQNNLPDSNNLFECSARAAVLLLLCSGRRVHDLTLLDIESKNCVLTDESVTFWPKFGSKTDTILNRQSGWRIYKNKDSQALNPIFWIQRMIELSQPRRTLCKKTSLFLTICGQPKEASRTNIANWVKKVLHQAGIKASPGSLRSAVASKNWIQSCPLDDILARGNWRSENTFLKYYCREIQSSPLPSSTRIVAQLFTPITE